MLSDVKILNQKDTTKFIEGGRTLNGVETTFKVGNDGPFMVFLPHEEFTGEANLRAIEAKADQVRVTRAGLGS